MAALAKALKRDGEWLFSDWNLTGVRVCVCGCVFVVYVLCACVCVGSCIMVHECALVCVVESMNTIYVF